MSLCQAYAKCRREVITIAEFKEDMWCFEPVIGLGFADRVSYFLDGHHHYPDNTRTLEAGRNWASHMPCFEYGKYQGIVISPIKSINFIPDILILYINPLQLTHLLITKNWIDGFDVTCSLSGHAACVYSTVPAIQRQQCWVTSPCKGDRRIAMAQDDEIIFSFPVDMLRNIVTGLKHLEDHNVRLPYPLEYSLEYDLKPEYANIGRMLGMNLGKSDDPKLRPRSTSKNKQ